MIGGFGVDRLLMIDMIYRDISVFCNDTDGKRITERAKLVICPNCEKDSFLVYLTGNSNHQHLQCIACGMSYCDGSCVQDK